jgi:hypothetical protein
VRVGIVGPALALSACGGYTPNYDLLAKGPSPEFNGTALAQARINQQAVLREISLMAGLPETGPVYPEQWAQFGTAALGRARLECNAYLTEIMKVEEHRRTINQQLGLAGAATAGILGIAGAASQAIAITAIAFGLVQGTVDNITVGLLYSLGAEPIQALVEKLRGAYREQLTDASWKDRATTFNTIYGYLELCTPVVLREKIKTAVVSVQVDATKVDRRGDPPRVSIAAQKVIETQIIRDVTRPLPTAPQQTNAAGTRPDERVPPGYVVELQRALCVTPANGTLDASTRQALKRFQSGLGRAQRAPDTYFDDLKQGPLMASLEEAMDKAGGLQCKDRGFLMNAFEVGLWGTSSKPQRAEEFRRWLKKMLAVLGSTEAPPAGDSELEAATRKTIGLVRAPLNVPGPADEFDFALFKKLQALPD